MRIVGGIHRGRILKAPKGMDVRPTADKPRQSLFDILMHGTPGGERFDIREKRVLDGFCGTGAFALEAISRGAAAAVMMDLDTVALSAARENVKELREEQHVRVVQADLTKPPAADNPCDLVFLDPPYGLGLGPPAMAALAMKGWIAPGALVVLETGAREKAAAPKGFAGVDERRVGAAKFLFFRYRA
jgi:16S rRNA (guanine966-N2)-methyltransferase